MKIEKSKTGIFTCWYVNGSLRFVRRSFGRLEFWKNGKRIEGKDFFFSILKLFGVERYSSEPSSFFWYINGSLRLAKHADGRKEYWKNGEIWKIKYADGRKEYWKNGEMYE